MWWLQMESLSLLFFFVFPWLSVRLVMFLHNHWPFHFMIACLYHMPVFLLDCAFFFLTGGSPAYTPYIKPLLLSVAYMVFHSIACFVFFCMSKLFILVSDLSIYFCIFFHHFLLEKSFLSLNHKNSPHIIF